MSIERERELRGQTTRAAAVVGMRLGGIGLLVTSVVLVVSLPSLVW